MDRPPGARRAALLRAAGQPLRRRDHVLQHPDGRAAADGRVRGGELRALVQPDAAGRAGVRHRRRGAAGLSQAVNPILETAIEQRNSVAGVGLVGALWSGVWWMSNMREAVSAQWELPAPNPAALQRLLFDLRALTGLGLALLVTLAFTVLGTGLTEVVLRLAGRTGRRRDPAGAAGGRHRARRRRELADLRVGDHPAAPHGRRVARRAAGGVARRRRLRGAQAGRHRLLRA